MKLPTAVIDWPFDNISKRNLMHVRTDWLCDLLCKLKIIKQVDIDYHSYLLYATRVYIKLKESDAI